jgi:hypothetical protein
MRERMWACLYLASMSGFAQATVINTQDAGVIAAFQSGATVNSFESISGRTPFSISSYNHNQPGDVISADANPNPSPYIFDQLPGVQFSVGGMVGTNEPALFKLTNGIAADAHSGSTVLGSVDFDFTTKFNNQGLIEIFFPTKVSKVGFWLNPSLGDVSIIALNTNFAFSKDPNEVNLETGTGTHGNFVGIERPTADIGGFKIQAKDANGFTIDDFTYGGASVVPEPGTWAFFAFALVMLGYVTRYVRQR